MYIFVKNKEKYVCTYSYACTYFCIKKIKQMQEKAQAMLLEKDSVITSLRARLKAGTSGGTHSQKSICSAPFICEIF
jgi:hypothetical protein